MCISGSLLYCLALESSQTTPVALCFCWFFPLFSIHDANYCLFLLLLDEDECRESFILTCLHSAVDLSWFFYGAMEVPGFCMILKFLWALPLVLRGVSWNVPSLEHKLCFFKFSWIFVIGVVFPLVSIWTHFVCELRQLSDLVNRGETIWLLFLERMLWQGWAVFSVSFLFRNPDRVL